MKVNRLKNKVKSKGEKELYDLLKNLFPVAVIYNNYPAHLITDTPNKKLSYDIYMKSFGILFEFDGAHHRKPVFYGKSEKDVFEAKRAYEERVKLDKEKNKLSKDAGLKLIRINSDKWKKMNVDERTVFIYDLL